MKTLRAWITFVDIADDQTAAADEAGQIAARRLQTYLNRALAGMSGWSRHASVGLNPTSASLDTTDLLVHVCTGSLIRDVANWSGLEVQGGNLGGVVGGATARFSGGVLSEVYWPWIKNHGSSATERGRILANQAIHEFAHNKCHGDGKVDPVSEVHANGGGGIFSAQVTPGTMRYGDLSSVNAKFLARFAGVPIKQYPYYLFNDDLGY
jgi:hypothetical protein